MQVSWKQYFFKLAACKASFANLKTSWQFYIQNMCIFQSTVIQIFYTFLYAEEIDVQIIEAMGTDAVDLLPLVLVWDDKVIQPLPPYAMIAFNQCVSSFVYNESFHIKFLLFQFSNLIVSCEKRKIQR